MFYNLSILKCLILVIHLIKCERKLKNAEQIISQGMFAIAFCFSAFAVAINMPALKSVFLLTHGMLPRYLSGRKSSSEPRCVPSSARWEDKIGFLFVEHHDDHSREGGTKQM